MEALGGFYLVLLAIAVVVVVLWICLPFAVFGVKSLLQCQNDLLVEQNDLLRQLLGRR